MKIVDNARFALVNVLTKVSSSSNRAGTNMNRLVRWISPSPRLRSQHQKDFRAISLMDRKVAISDAHNSVKNMMQKNEALAHQSNKMLAKAFELVKVGQGFEARLLMEEYLREQVPDARAEGARSLKDAYQDLQDVVQGDRARKRHSAETIESMNQELKEAYQFVLNKSEQNPEETDSPHVEKFKQRFEAINTQAKETVESNAAFWTKPNHLSTEILRETGKGNHLMAIKLAEHALLAAGEGGQKLGQDVLDVLEKNPRTLSNNSQKLIRAAGENMNDAIKVAVEGGSYDLAGFVGMRS